MTISERGNDVEFKFRVIATQEHLEQCIGKIPVDHPYTSLERYPCAFLMFGENTYLVDFNGLTELYAHVNGAIDYLTEQDIDSDDEDV